MGKNTEFHEKKLLSSTGTGHRVKVNGRMNPSQYQLIDKNV